MPHIPKHRLPFNRPPWWPANEPWPPVGRPGRKLRGHFFWQIVRPFVLFILGVSLIINLLIGFEARLLGLLQIPSTLAWVVIPLSIAISILGFGLLALAGRGLRRMSIPFDHLLEAAGRVAEGDYTVRVDEQGPQEVRSLAHAFNSMAARLQITTEQRRDLLADVTHELRTPLTVIQGNVEAMLDGVYAPDAEHLYSILEETKILARLVDDLRTLALAESGALQLKKELTDLAVLVGETAAAFRGQAAAAGVTLQVDAGADAPLLKLDPERMHEVLSNLIANALRYTPPGGKIEVSFRMSGAGGENRAFLSIQDSGPGISPEDLEHVFDRFYKAHESGGMGLGLSIAKHLVEAHGGTIQVQSEPGKGTTIHIDLPDIR
jgi:signal transduction histidine kinase